MKPNNTKRLSLTAGIILTFGSLFYLNNNREVRPTANTNELTQITKTNSFPSERKATQYPGGLKIESTDVYDAQFKHQVLPVTQRFFSKLEKLGMSPLQGNLADHKIGKVGFMPHKLGTNCNFIIDDKWIMQYTSVKDSPQTKQFEEITSFKLRKELDPYNWTKDTNHIAGLQPLNPTHITIEEATSKIHGAFTAFNDSSKFNHPFIDPVKPYGYDLNCFQGIYRGVGSDPLNQLNPQIILGIQPQSDKVILNFYQDTGTYWKN